MLPGRLAGVLTAAIIAASVSAGAASLKDAQQAFNTGHFPEALAAWSDLAAAGDPKAELGLGVLYDLGDGVARDAAAALHWYRRAAEAGLPDAELNVAVMYDSGRGTARDAAAAALWYARAAAHHDHRAEYDLAQLYADGDGVPKNDAMAEAWLRAAAAGGLDAAGERLSAQHRPASDQRLPAGAPASVGLVPATPSSPADDGTVQRDSVTRDAELVWTAPPQPVPSRFYVQVLALGQTGPVPVFSGYTDVSSVLVPVEPAHGSYIWRVYVVGAALRSYLPSGWRRFSVIWRGSQGAG